ncbi:hypothetical protein [Clostridium sp. 001]|uniref:hypothetical protein n=1 Tax=Clostridium sp. 001 TaxID=1970093 RepID=UPI001C2CA9F5|nr:hypothetical protein [Clostridium sp. 001]
MFNIGERVYVDAWDVKGYGIMICNSSGLHVLVDGFKAPMYFQDHEVKKIKF